MAPGSSGNNARFTGYLHEGFQPAILEGMMGRGAKGRLDADRIRSMASRE
jgi:hypothetical protein